MNDPILVNCRNCGKKALSTEFSIDPILGVMVCKECKKNSGKKTEDKKQKEPKPKINDEKPSGWDAEDDYVTKLYKKKKAENSHVVKISEDKAQVTCPNCGFKFMFNTEKNFPRNCPNCGARAVK